MVGEYVPDHPSLERDLLFGKVRPSWRQEHPSLSRPIASPARNA